MKWLSVLLLSVMALAQSPPTNTPQFSVSMNFLEGSPYGTSSAMDSAFTSQFTTDYLLRGDVIVMPSANYTGYFGGVQYDLAVLCPLLDTTSLNCGKFGMYVNGAVGLGRVQTASTPANSSVAGLARVGANYDLTGAGKYTLNLFECGWGSFGAGARSAVFCQTGFNFGFGSNALASQAKLERWQRSQAKKAKKLREKMEKQSKWHA